LDHVETLFLFPELSATTGIEHAVFKMFYLQVPHAAWLAVVGIYILLGIAALVDLSRLFKFHIYLSKYMSQVALPLSRCWYGNTSIELYALIS